MTAFMCTSLFLLEWFLCINSLVFIFRTDVYRWTHHDFQLTNLLNRNKNRHVKAWFTILLFIIIPFLSKIEAVHPKFQIQAQCRERRLQKQSSTKKRKGRGDHNQKYVQMSEYVQKIPSSPQVLFKSDFSTTLHSSIHCNAYTAQKNVVFFCCCQP